MLTRRFRLAALVPLVLSGCSTALLVDTPYDDVDLEPDAGVTLDAGLPRDAGQARDATVPRDGAGADAARDSAVVDAATAFPRDCATALPSEGFATLYTNDCASRPQQMCASQLDLDRELVAIANRCRAPRRVSLGFTTSGVGCPDQLRYDQASVRGQVSQCLQGELEALRFTCPSRCGLIRTGDTP